MNDLERASRELANWLREFFIAGNIYDQIHGWMDDDALSPADCLRHMLNDTAYPGGTLFWVLTRQRAAGAGSYADRLEAAFSKLEWLLDDWCRRGHQEATSQRAWERCRKAAERSPGQRPELIDRVGFELADEFGDIVVMAESALITLSASIGPDEREAETLVDSLRSGQRILAFSQSQAEVKGAPCVGDGEPPILEVNLSRDTAKLGDTVYKLSGDQVLFLAAVVRGERQQVSRPERIRQKLPEELVTILRWERGKGHWIDPAKARGIVTPK